MAQHQEQFIPAIPGTLSLSFKFVVSVKASEQQVKDRTVKRPVICWRLVGDRPFPVVLGSPVEVDPESEGIEVVVVPGSGLLVDPLTGQVWGSDELYIRHVAGLWGGWLKEHAPAAAAAPQRVGPVGHVVLPQGANAAWG